MTHDGNGIGHTRQTIFRFHGELNDFLPRERRSRAFSRDVPPKAAVKDVIESLGVPHTEVDVILVNGESAGFFCQLEGGEQIEVYPWSLVPPVAPVCHLRPRPAPRPRFVLDAHLGKLARHLRLLGFDCRYHHAIEDDEIAKLAESEKRIVLSRDRGLLMRRRIEQAHFVRNIKPLAQLEEVCSTFDLVNALAPFTRCTRCNGLLVEVDKADVQDRLEPRTRAHVEHFFECENCGHLYWHGSHVERMRSMVERLRKRLQ